MEQLKEVIPAGISKINMDTDIRLATFRNVLEYFKKNPEKQTSKIYQLILAKPENFDYRYYLTPIMEQIVNGAKDTEESLVMKKLMAQAIDEIVIPASVNFGDVGDSDFIERKSLEEMKNIYKNNL